MKSSEADNNTRISRTHVQANTESELNGNQSQATERVQGGGGGGGPHLAANELPQPQLAAAFGFSCTTNAERIRSDS